MNEDAMEKSAQQIAGQKFHNSSKYDFAKLMGDQIILPGTMRNYLAGFSSNARGDYREFSLNRDR